MADLSNVQLGERVSFTGEQLDSMTPLQDVKIGERVRFNADDLANMNPVQVLQEEQTYYKEDEDTVIGAPPGIKEKELTFLNDTQNKEAEKGSFFGFVDTAEKATSAIGLGAEATVAALPQVPAGLKLEFAETFKQELEKDIGFFDVAKAFLPTTKGIANRQKLLNAIGIGDKKEGLAKSERMIKASNDMIEANRQYLKDNNLVRPEGFEGVFFDIGGVGTTIFASIGMSIATRSAAPAATLFGTLQKSDSYIEAREKGFGVDAASNISTVLGLGEAGLEMLGVNIFLKAFKNSKPVNRIIFRTLEEAAQEGAQQTFEEVVTQTTGLREVDIKGAIGRVAYSMALGSLGGASVASVVEAGTSIAKEENVSPQTVKDLAKAIVNNNEAIENEVVSMVEDQTSPIKADPKAEAETAKIIKDFQEGREIDVTVVPPTAAGRPDEDRIEERKAEAKVVKGRVKELDKQISNIDKAIDADEKLLAERKEAGKTTQAIESRMEKQLAERETLDEERAEILLAEKPLDVQKVTEQAKEKEITIKGKEVTKLGAKVAEEGIRKFKKGFREGKRLVKKDIKKSQEAAITAIEDAGLSLQDKAKFTKAIKNIQSSEDLRKAFPDIQRRVERLINAEASRKQKARINKALKTKAIKPKVQAGKIVGKFDAATQERLKELQTLNTISAKVEKEGEFEGTSPASRLLEKRIDEGVDDPLGNAILFIKTDADVKPEFIKYVADYIAAIKEVGMIEAQKRFNKRKAKAEIIREDIDSFIDSKGELLTYKRIGSRAVIKKVGQNIRQVVARLAESWDDIIDRVAPGTSVKELDIVEEISKQKKISRVMQNKLIVAAQKAYNEQDASKIVDILDKSNAIEDLGIFTNLRGEEIRIEISRAQARKVWMEYQSPKIRENTLQSEKGNGYTDEMLGSMFRLLTKEDKDFALAQMDIYEDFYNDVNKVYARVFGVNLPQEDFYSPIAREVDIKDTNTDPFLREIGFRKAIASGKALKVRDKNAVLPLAVRSDLLVYNSHITEMSRFIAFREKTQLLTDVFGDNDLRRKIEAKFGKEFLKMIDDELQSISGAAMANTTILDRGINYLNRNFATSVLGLKAKIGMTQISSYFAYAEFVPTKAFISGSRDFVLNYKKAVKILSQSELMQARGASLEVDIARIGKTFDSQFLRKVQKKKENLIDYTLIFTKLGDRATIYMGGWSVYKHAIDSGKTHEQAITEFERATSKTQQSADIDKLSFLQKSSPIIRGLTMFMSAPIAQYRGEVRAFRDFMFKKEITKAEFGKRLLIYHFLIPQFYQALANGLLFGEYDEEDQWRAAIFGSLNGIPVMGDVLDGAMRKIFGESSGDKDLFKWSSTLKDIIVDAYDALVFANEGDYEIATEIMLDMGKNIGSIVGVPTPQLGQIAEGIELLQDGETKPAIMRFLGFPDSVADAE